MSEKKITRIFKDNEIDLGVVFVTCWNTRISEVQIGETQKGEAV